MFFLPFAARIALEVAEQEGNTKVSRFARVLIKIGNFLAWSVLILFFGGFALLLLALA